MMVSLLSVGGVTSIGLEPELTLSATMTFRGMETMEHWRMRNVWIGPDLYFLIRMYIVYDRSKVCKLAITQHKKFIGIF